MNDIDFYDTYINKLKEYKDMYDTHAETPNFASAIEDQVETIRYLTTNFDKFKEILHKVDFGGFPYAVDEMLNQDNYGSIFGPRRNLYLDSQNFRRLLIGRDTYVERLRKLAKRRRNPLFWIERSLVFILSIPRKIIQGMGFNPDKFIDTFWGKVIALTFLALVLSFLGISLNQILDFIIALLK